MRATRSLAVLVLVALSASTLRASVKVGDPAPAVEPVEWLNTKGPMSWKDLKGRLILVEKWATWCGPCRASIPHMNELLEKYEKKGLAIIGVTEEAVGTVKPFISANDMKYIIAIKGAPDYKTDGIPHGWLVNPKGIVVWEGHPADLKDEMFEEHLKGASVTPQFTLPRELKAAEKDLNAGSFGAGLKALDAHLKKPKNAETESAAKAAAEQVNAYGASELQRADELVKEKLYGDAQAILKNLEKSFKDHETGTKAKDILAKWKDDKAIKLELEGASTMEKAEALIQAKQGRQAAGLLAQVAKQKKFDGTKVQELAKKKLAAVEKTLK